MSKRIITTLNDLQLQALKELMESDLEVNQSAYIGRLITQEKIRRQQDQLKRSVGRPKKDGESKKLYYPAPYKGGAPYDKETLEAYYAFRKEEMPPLPQPLTDDELKQWDM